MTLVSFRLLSIASLKPGRRPPQTRSIAAGNCPGAAGGCAGVPRLKLRILGDQPPQQRLGVQLRIGPQPFLDPLHIGIDPRRRPTRSQIAVQSYMAVAMSSRGPATTKPRPR